MKKLFLSVAIVIVFLICMPIPTFAHFPATDGNMTVTLHVDPDDNPIPGQPAHLFFIFSDITGAFSLSHCECNVTVAEHGEIIAHGRVTPSSVASIYGQEISVVFPKRDVYTIAIVGKPKNGATFQPFALTWNFRVDQLPLEQSNGIAWQTIALPIAVAVGCSLLLFIVIGVIVKIVPSSEEHHEKNS